MGSCGRLHGVSMQSVHDSHMSVPASGYCLPLGRLHGALMRALHDALMWAPHTIGIAPCGVAPAPFIAPWSNVVCRSGACGPAAGTGAKCTFNRRGLGRPTSGDCAPCAGVSGSACRLRGGIECGGRAEGRSPLALCSPRSSTFTSASATAASPGAEELCLGRAGETAERACSASVGVTLLSVAAAYASENQCLCWSSTTRAPSACSEDVREPCSALDLLLCDKSSTSCCAVCSRARSS